MQQLIWCPSIGIDGPGIAQTVHDDLVRRESVEEVVFKALQDAILKGKSDLQRKGYLSNATYGRLKTVLLKILGNSIEITGDLGFTQAQSEDIKMVFMVINTMPGLGVLKRKYSDVYAAWSGDVG